MALLALLITVCAARTPGIELPPGPAADLAAKLGAEVDPAKLPSLAEGPWDRPETWKRWAELLTAEASAMTPDPARRAELALLSLAQGRFDDAWIRFTDCAASPSIAAALLPRFLPGTKSATLADGAVLTPALPPSNSPDSLSKSSLRGGIERRAMRIDGLAVGSAVIAMRVSVEVEGIQIDVEHVSGGSAKLAIAIPKDERYDFSDEYVDWYRQEEKGVPHTLTVAPGDEPHTLYARFEPRAPEWPTLLPEKVPAHISSGGIRLEARGGEADLNLLRAVAESLAAGPLHLPCSLRNPDAPPEPFTGVSIDLSDPGNRARKLAWIVGAVESRALARPR